MSDLSYRDSQPTVALDMIEETSPTPPMGWGLCISLKAGQHLRGDVTQECQFNSDFRRQHAQVAQLGERAANVCYEVVGSSPTLGTSLASNSYDYIVEEACPAR